MSLPPSALNIICVSLYTFNLILGEYLFAQRANYSYKDGAHLFSLIATFGGISLGNILSMFSWTQAFTRQMVMLGVSLLTPLCYAAVLVGGWFGWASIFLLFTAYGLLIPRFFEEYDLSTLIVSLGIGGCLFYLSLETLAPIGGDALVYLSACLFLLLAFQYKLSILKFGTASLILLLFFFGHLFIPSQPSSALAGLNPNLANLTPLIKPIYNQLFKTELLQYPDGKRQLMVINGSRFAVIPTQKNYLQRMQGSAPSQPAYDTPYVFLQPKKVLIIGAAEGFNIIAALRNKAEAITAVDINPAVFTVMQGPAAQTSGNFYNDPKVQPVVAEGRHFLETSQENFDLITLQGVQTGSTSHMINSTYLESFLFTKEALQTIWQRLSPNGAVYLDEYLFRSHTQEGPQPILQIVASMAQRDLPLQNAAAQVRLYEYSQPTSNPMSTHRRLKRNGLIISKRPILETEHQAILASFQSSQIRSVPILKLQPSSDISDNRPGLMLFNFQKYQIPFLILALLIVTLPIFTLKKIFAVPLERQQGLSLYFLGSSFIAIILSLTGPLSLWLGHPGQATSFIFFFFYFYSLVGGLVALRISAYVCQISTVVFTLSILGVLFSLPQLDAWLLPQNSYGLRILAVALVLFPLAFFCEIPYIGFLKNTTGKTRAWSYNIENIGTLAAIPLCLILQMTYGFQATLAIAAFFAACAWLSTPNIAAFFKPNFLRK